MNTKTQVVIIGAGPTGLAAAIFLSEQNIKPRIIEKLKEHVPYSKAFGINPRTLSLFEQSGITKQFLGSGRKMQAINIWKNGKCLLKNDFRKVKGNYPFMLIQSQHDTEKILEEELLRRGIAVERETSLTQVSTENGTIAVTLETSSEKKEELKPDYVFGADGAHSAVRHKLNFDFAGGKDDKIWELYDLELDMPLAHDEGHIVVKNEGAMLLIRIKDNVWRLAGNIPNLIRHLPVGIATGKIVWESKFTISHRIASRLQEGNIFIGGDAAHLHSPLGARGMNLGIQDAYVFAELFGKGKTADYEKLRKPVIAKTVNRVNTMTRVMTGQSALSYFIRRMLPVLSIGAPMALPTARKFILDLD